MRLCCLNFKWNLHTHIKTCVPKVYLLRCVRCQPDMDVHEQSWELVFRSECLEEDITRLLTVKRGQLTRLHKTMQAIQDIEREKRALAGKIAARSGLAPGLASLHHQQVQSHDLNEQTVVRENGADDDDALAAWPPLTGGGAGSSATTPWLRGLDGLLGNAKSLCSVDGWTLSPPVHTMPL